jgi:hypothetical protein
MELIRYIKTTLGPKIITFEKIADEIKTVYNDLSQKMTSIRISNEQFVTVKRFDRLVCKNNDQVNVVISNDFRDGDWVVISDGVGSGRAKNNIIITTEGNQKFSDGSDKFIIDIDNGVAKLQLANNIFYLTGV